MIASYILSEGDIFGGEMIEENGHRYSLQIMERPEKKIKADNVCPILSIFKISNDLY